MFSFNLFQNNMIKVQYILKKDLKQWNLQIANNKIQILNVIIVQFQINVGGKILM